MSTPSDIAPATVMTLQAIYDRVKTHLLTQMQQSRNEPEQGMTGKCMYRGVDGLKCAVGCLIPDALYSPDLDNAPAQSTSIHSFRPVQQVLVRAGVMPAEAVGSICHPYMRLLVDLQPVHDSVRPDQWYERLATVASDHHLVP